MALPPVEVAVHDKNDLETYGKDHLSFDCPWCGAIAGVDPSRVGEPFVCPECEKSTKLTKENTRAGPLAEAPPDAPPSEEAAERGRLTFDCPWCGAISAVGASRLGEHYACPECQRSTKLTEHTTRKADLTEPPPDAPPAEGGGSKVPLVVGGLLAVVVVVVLAVVLGKSSDEGGDGAKTARGPEDRAPIPGGPSETPETPPPGEGDTDAPGTPPADPDGQAPDGQAPDDEADAAARAALAAQVAAAEAELTVATEALATWEAANAERVEVLGLRAASGDLAETMDRLRADLIDPAAVKPAAVRAFNAAVRDYVAGDAARVRVVGRLVAWLDQDGAMPLRIKKWEQMNFFAPRARDGLEAIRGEWAAEDATEWDQLREAVEAAQSDVTVARGAMGEMPAVPAEEEPPTGEEPPAEEAAPDAPPKDEPAPPEEESAPEKTPTTPEKEGG